jgi:hypothetical protein
MSEQPITPIPSRFREGNDTSLHDEVARLLKDVKGDKDEALAIGYRLVNVHSNLVMAQLAGRDTKLLVQSAKSTLESLEAFVGMSLAQRVRAAISSAFRFTLESAFMLLGR